MSILNSLLNNKKVRTQKLHINNNSITKLDICFFITTSSNLDSAVICDFCVRTLMLLYVMNANLAHPHLPYLFILNKPRQNSLHHWFWVRGLKVQ